MPILTFLSGAMLGGIITLLLHCCLIVGKESEKWEDELTMKKEETKE